MSSKENWYRRLQDAQAIWEYPGHGPHAVYELEDKHAGVYFNSDVATANPRLAADIVRTFVDICKARRIHPDWIVTYTAIVTSMIVPAAKLALPLSAGFGTIDLRDDSLHFKPQPEQTILFVTDDVHSGHVIAQMAALVEKTGAVVLPFLLTIANFSGSPTFRQMEIISLFDVPVEAYTPDICPLCQAGSEPLKARRMWHKLKGHS